MTTSKQSKLKKSKAPADAWARKRKAESADKLDRKPAANKITTLTTNTRASTQFRPAGAVAPPTLAAPVAAAVAAAPSLGQMQVATQESLDLQAQATSKKNIQTQHQMQNQITAIALAQQQTALAQQHMLRELGGVKATEKVAHAPAPPCESTSVATLAPVAVNEALTEPTWPTWFANAGAIAIAIAIAGATARAAGSALAYVGSAVLHEPRWLVLPLVYFNPILICLSAFALGIHSCIRLHRDFRLGDEQDDQEIAAIDGDLERLQQQLLAQQQAQESRLLGIPALFGWGNADNADAADQTAQIERRRARLEQRRRFLINRLADRDGLGFFLFTFFGIGDE